MVKKVKQLLKKEKTIVAYGSYTLLSNIVGTIIGIGTNLPLSTILGPVGFGTLKIITSFFGQIPIRLGMEATLSKYPPQWKEQNEIGKIKYLLKSFFRLRLVFITLFSLIFFACRKQLSLHLLKNSVETHLIDLGIIFFIISYFDLIRPTILGFRNYKLNINTSLTIAILKGGLGLILALLFGIAGAILAYPLALLLGIIPALSYLKKRELFSRPSTLVNVRKIFKEYSLPAYLVNLTGLIGSFSTPLLALLFGPESIGHYSFALMLASPIALVSGAVGQIFFPEVALEHARNGKDASFQKLRRVLVLFLSSCALLIPLGTLLTRPLIHHFAPDYLTAIPLARYLFFLYVFIGSLSLTTSYYMAIGRNKIAGLSRFLSAFGNFFFSFLILKIIN